MKCVVDSTGLPCAVQVVHTKDNVATVDEACTGLGDQDS